MFSSFIKMWEIGDYMCGESQDTNGRQKTPAKCRGDLVRCVLKKLSCLSRLPCEEMILHYENLLFLRQCKF